MTELIDFYTFLQTYSDCATGFTSIWTFCITVRDNISGEEFTRRGSDISVCQTMNGAALVDDRSGVTFSAELCIPWDAPEAVVDIDSLELVSLGSFPDKVGLFGRRKDAAASRILMGRDSRSMRFLVPDSRGVDRSYHDVTVVDMEDEREPMVVATDMTRLRELWPAEVFSHMKWYQQDLEQMRKSAKKQYSQTRPMPCRFCGKVIRVDMYRHVARLHLDLVQLWRCPIAWCPIAFDVERLTAGLSMMLRGFPKRPALRNTRLHGLSVVSYGLIRYEWSIPVSPRTYCCSVRSVCR